MNTFTIIHQYYQQKTKISIFWINNGLTVILPVNNQLLSKKTNWGVCFLYAFLFTVQTSCIVNKCDSLQQSTHIAKCQNYLWTWLRESSDLSLPSWDDSCDSPPYVTLLQAGNKWEAAFNIIFHKVKVTDKARVQSSSSVGKKEDCSASERISHKVRVHKLNVSFRSIFSTTFLFKWLPGCFASTVYLRTCHIMTQVQKKEPRKNFYDTTPYYFKKPTGCFQLYSTHICDVGNCPLDSDETVAKSRNRQSE